jgi:cytochrome c-type biogenesis protein CcmH/NrfG
LNPVDRDTEALLWLTLGNAYGTARDWESATEAYHRAQALAKPESAAYKEASEALRRPHYQGGLASRLAA